MKIQKLLSIQNDMKDFDYLTNAAMSNAAPSQNTKPDPSMSPNDPFAPVEVF